MKPCPKCESEDALFIGRVPSALQNKVDRFKVVDISPADKGAISRHYAYGDVDWPDEPATSYVGLDTSTGCGRLVLGAIEEVKEMLE